MRSDEVRQPAASVPPLPLQAKEGSGGLSGWNTAGEERPRQPRLTAYLSLGSNLGNRDRNLAEAVRRLGTTPGVEVRRVSSVYETAPVGGPPQGDFLNLVVELATTLSPRELLAACQAIEADLGRERTVRWGPRTIDLDVLIYEGVTSADPELTLPHPRMLERQFVLRPLAEIAPDLVLPDGRTAAQAAQT